MYMCKWDWLNHAGLRGHLYNLHNRLYKWRLPLNHAGLGHLYTCTPYGGTCKCASPH